MGSLPKRYYDDKPDSKGYMRQFQIVAFWPPEGIGCLDVDDQLELGRLHYR